MQITVGWCTVDCHS